MTRTAVLGVSILLAACGSGSPPPPPSASAVGSATPTAAAAPTGGRDAGCLGESAPPDALPSAGTGPRVPALSTVQFVSARQGWAAGRGYILATADGGAGWSVQYQGPAELTFVDFVDARTGWAVAEDRLLGTGDGGGCWRQLVEPEQPLVSVHFVDARRGWGVTGSTAPRTNGLPNTPVLGDGVPVQPGGGRLVTTDDGGHSWRSSSGTPADVQSVCFSGSDHGWLGAGGRLYRSADGGGSWHEVPGLPGQAGGGGVVSLQCAAPDSVWLLDLSLEGALGNQPYAALASTGGGALTELFEDMFSGSVDRPNPGSYPGPLSVITATTAAFLGFTPALPANPTGFEEATLGARGVSITHVTHVPGVDQAWAASFISPTTGWLVGDSGSRSVILVTSDGGRTWARQYRTVG